MARRRRRSPPRYKSGPKKGQFMPRSARKRHRKARAAAPAAAAPRRRRRRGRRRARAAAPVAAAPRRKRHRRRRAREIVEKTRRKGGRRRQGPRRWHEKRRKDGRFKSTQTKSQRRARRRAASRKRARRGGSHRRGGSRRRAKRIHMTQAEYNALRRAHRRVRRGRKVTRRQAHVMSRISRRKARENPVTFMDTMAVVAAGAAGFFFASLADRFVSTHALLTVGGNPADGPPVGEVYNTEAVTAPIWSNWKRLAVAAGAIGVPLLVSAKGPSAWKTTMRGVAIGAAVRTVGKSLDDLSAKLMGTSAMGERLFAQEIKSQNGMLNAAATAPNALPIGSGGNGQGVHILQSSGTAAAGAVPAATRSAGTGGMLSVFKAQHGPGVGAPLHGHSAPRQFNPPPPPAQPQPQPQMQPQSQPRDITRPIQHKHPNGLAGLAAMSVPKIESSDEAAE